MRAFAVLFPGQGSQYTGMGAEFHAAHTEARTIFDEADTVLGEPLSRTCFAGTADDLARTETTQPAVLTVAIAAWRVLEARGARPAAAAGHSLGEYAAHVAAGTLTFRDAVAVVRQRGRFMQEAVPIGLGAMAALLGLDVETVTGVCREAAQDEVVAPANLNAPGQIVIAGHATAVDRAVAGARRAGAKRAVPLAVSAPFHCDLMRPAAERLAALLDGVPFRDPLFPVWTNVDARPVRAAAEARASLIRQVASPVRWQETIEGMVAAGVDTFVELGPGRVLSGLVRRIVPEARVASVERPGDVANALAFLEAS